MRAITALLIIGLIVSFGLSFASDCTDACQADYNRVTGNAQALYDGKGYYTGDMNTNCANLAEERAGIPDSCIIAFIGRPATNTAGCLDNCQDAACNAGCNDAFQSCCLAAAKTSAEIWRTECLAACPTETVSKCADVTCYDKCEYGVEYRSGSCNENTGLCIYATANTCPYGCDQSAPAFCASAPEPTQPTQKGCTVSTDAMFSYCKAYCQSKTTDDCSVTAASSETPGILYSCECMCGQSPDYTYPSYSGIDCTGSAPARMTSTTQEDKCANVQCDDKCDGNTLKTGGYCDSNTGNCIYSETQCGDIGCNESSLTCNQQAPGKIAGTVHYTEFMGVNGEGDLAGSDVPLRFVKVKTYYTDSDGNIQHAKSGDEYVTYTDSNGKFSIEVPPDFFAPNVSSITINITLEDEGKHVKISQDSLNDPKENPGAEPLTFQSMYGYKSDLSRLDFNFYNEGSIWPSAAQIYSNVLKAVEFKENVIGLSPTTEERVTIFSQNGTWHMTELDPILAEQGMFIKKKGSAYFNYEAPVNREFHEYCHHIQAEAWGQESKRNPPGDDHAGYPANIQSSEWGVMEGWAEFCALEMKKYYYGTSDAKYPALNTVLNLELNYKIQGDYLYDASKSNYLSSKFAEELAIAGIFIDLRDSASDYGGSDDDDVSMPLSEIWGAFSSERDFGDGAGVRHVHTVHDFYVAISQAAGPSMQGAIDQIFIKHGAFQDLNKNGIWDSGEPIGYSGIGGTSQADYRPDLEPEPGTQIMVNAKDGSGNTLANGVLINVSVSFDGANSYLSYSYRAPVVDGMIYLPLPPREYNATITMTAVQGGSNAKASTSYTTTTAQAYAEIDPTKPLATYDAAIPSAKPQTCSSAGQCIAWNMGDTCKSGSCTYATGSGTTASGALCLGPAAIAFVVGLLAWRRKG